MLLHHLLPCSSARVAVFKQAQVEEMRALPDATALSYMQVGAADVVPLH